MDKCMVYDFNGNRFKNINKNKAGFLLRKKQAVLIQSEPMTIELIPDKQMFQTKEDFLIYKEERKALFTKEREFALSNISFSEKGDELMSQNSDAQLNNSDYFYISVFEYLSKIYPDYAYQYMDLYLDFNNNLQHDNMFSSYALSKEGVMHIGAFFKELELNGKKSALQFLRRIGTAPSKVEFLLRQVHSNTSKEVNMENNTELREILRVLNEQEELKMRIKRLNYTGSLVGMEIENLDGHLSLMQQILDDLYQLEDKIQAQISSKIYTLISKSVGEVAESIIDLNIDVSDCIFELKDIGNDNITVTKKEATNEITISKL